jgi:CDP-2,3-bis-(O-geranylgeranyl)-sn-glycerol synthase
VTPVLRRVLQLVYLMLPAYAANMTPPFLRYWKGWNPPIARRLLGDHKTVLGFASGIGSAVLAAFVQSRIAWEGSLVHSDQWLALGLRFGIGAMTGDSAKSFVKRRVGIAPGEPWIPFDQLDFVIGALVLTWSRAPLSWLDGVLILLVSAGGHILVTHLGFWLRIRDTKW